MITSPLTSYKNHFFVTLVAVILAAIFCTFPNIDNAFSNLFYDPERGFYLEENMIVYIIRKSAPIISTIFVIVALLFASKTLRDHKSIHPKFYKKIIFVTLVCLLGPGLLVHNGLKDHFGRARPNETINFGGEKNFTAAFQFSDQCSKNCSFVSGHSSVGFMFIALAFILRGWQRRFMVKLSIALGFIIGLSRIMEGDHYLSDVIFSGFAVYFTAFYLNIIIKPMEKF